MNREIQLKPQRDTIICTCLNTDHICIYIYIYNGEDIEQLELLNIAGGNVK